MPRNITITFQDGTTHTYQNAPDNVTPDEVQARAEKQFSKTVTGIDGGKNVKAEEPRTTIADDAKQFGRDVLGGLTRGAAGIGSTLLEAAKYTNPVSAIREAISGPAPLENIKARTQAVESGLSGMGVDTESIPYAGGKLASEIAGTAGVGPAIGGIRALSQAAPRLAQAIQTAGMRTGGAPATLGQRAADLGIRTTGGAVTGAGSAGLVDPDSAMAGGAIGAAAPGAFQAAGRAGQAVGNVAGSGVRALAGGGVSDEVARLASRAKELGIDVPADRLVNSRPLNALASGLSYTPFSGRAASEDLMNSQLNRAVSRSFGQDSSNVTMALRKAEDQLGSQFEHVLRNNAVKVDDEFLNALGQIESQASKELGSDSLKPILSQINEIIEKGSSGQIDGQAAYNIKRTLDRIGRRNTPEGYHALELKGALMEALNRSLGPEKAAQFATTRKQYSNMLALEKLAPSGAEGEISAARLANLKNINNPELQELADIAAQFIKPREGQHGAAQRALVGAGVFSMGGPASLATGAVAGRTANAALNSQKLRSLMLGEQLPPGRFKELLANPEVQQLMYRSAPLAPTE